MINHGVILKSIRETWLLTLLCAIGAFGFEALFAYVLWTFQEEFAGDLMQVEFVRNVIKAFFGQEFADQLGPSALHAVAWLHPLIITIFWAHAVTYCTRLPAGEIDRGTADLLFGLPLRRSTIFASDAIVWLGSGLLLGLAAFLGSASGHRLIPPQGRPEFARVAIVAVNLVALYVASGAMVSFISSMNSRRGRAVGGAVAIFLLFFLLNVLAQYWGPAQRISFLTLLNYYEPLPILNGEQLWPITDLLILLAVAALALTASAATLARRDIRTV